MISKVREYQWEVLTLLVATLIAVVLAYGGTPKEADAGNLAAVAAKDAKIRQASPTNNYATGDTMLVDGDDANGTGNDSRVLIEWDLSSIPQGAKVDAVSFTLEGFSSGNTFKAHEVLKEWNENEVTWNKATSSLNWSTAGAKGATDSVAATSADIGPNPTQGELYLELDYALVQKWVDNPANNHGIVIEGDAFTSDGMGIFSEEHTTALAPNLDVFYTDPEADPSDTTPPTATIDSGPAEGGTITQDSPSFTFSANDIVTFYCSIGVQGTPVEEHADGESCVSGKTYSDLPNGAYSFGLVAEDDGGNASTAISRNFTIDVDGSGIPGTTIDSGPSGDSTQTYPYTANFAFSSGGSPSGYECRLYGDDALVIDDAGILMAWEPCSSVKSYANLYPGKYEFQVRALSSSGAQDPSPAKNPFTLLGEVANDVEGENLVRPVDSTQLVVVDDAAASAGKTMKFTGTRDTASALVTLNQEGDFRLTAKGVLYNNAWPKVHAYIDGDQLTDKQKAIDTSSLSTHVINTDLPAGTYDVGLKSTNATSTRALYVDKVEFIGRGTP